MKREAGASNPKPMTRPWDDIQAFYEKYAGQLPGLAPLLKLVQQIQGSRYATGIHAWTSMHDLCIVPNPRIYPDSIPCLRIHPFYDGSFEFRYIDTPIERKQWRRLIEGDELFPRLERFLDQMRWLPNEECRRD
jgi:hypothetical protein